MEKLAEARRLPNMVITRNAVPEDQKWVAKVFDANKKVLGNTSGGTVFYRWTKNNNPRERWIVVEEMAFVHFLERLDGTKVIYEIAVHPDFKRLGLGGKLLRYVGLPVELKTDADHEESNNFYLKNGFKKIGYKESGAGKKMAIYQKW